MAITARDVLGFGPQWAAILWGAMRKTGKGYRMYSLKHTGRGDDRRKDKLEAERKGIPPCLRRYQSRYA